MDRLASKPIDVLHVDDDPDFGELAKTFLERETDHCTVETATSASDGLDRLAEHDFDCIVSDYDMPGRSGIEFLERVRAEYPDLPFILFTGKGSEQVASEAISAGVTDYLQKEGGTDQYTVLANRIANAVSRYRAERHVTRVLDTIDTAHDGISLLDEAGEFIYVNESYAELFGYDREELLGNHWEILYPDEAVSRVYDTMLPQARDGEWEGTTNVLCKDGTQITVDHSLTYTEGDTLVCTVSEPSDEQLKETLVLREQAMDEAPIGITLTDPSQPDNPIVYANDSFVELTGYPREEIIGRNCRFLQGPDTREEPVTAMREAIDAGEPVTVELRNYRKDGSMFWNQVLITPIRDDTGTITNWTGFQYEITDRVEYERQLQAQNERLDEFASILSHDLRNPLNVAMSRLALVQDQDESGSEHLDAVAQAHERIEQLIEEVLTVAQEGEIATDVQPISLAKTVERCRQVIEMEGVRISIETDLTLRADESRLRQLLENLIQNAVDHSDDDVTIRIGGLPEADGFYVADDGPGIPKDERLRVFEDGYTTSEAGIGLGLSMVKRIAEAHGWDVTVTDSAEGGARFEITGVEFAAE